MKKKYLIILVLVAFFAACTDKFEEFNTDTKSPAIVTGEALFSNAQLALADQTSSTNVNLNVWKLFAQHWTETTYVDEANYDIVNRSIPDMTFREYYRGFLKDFNEAAKVIENTRAIDANGEIVKANKLAIIELMNAYAYQGLVDIFGNVPYTEALDINNLAPKYDDAAAIYADLIVRINAALADLDDSQGSFGSADLIYSGDVAAWKKFGNSLKLKVGIALADVNPTVAKPTVEAAIASGVFTSSADDALFNYLPAIHPNQIYIDVVQSGRDDFIPANTIVDIMNDLNDPRLFSYFSGPVSFRNPVRNFKKQDSTFTDVNRLLFYETADGLSDSIVFKEVPYTIFAADSLNIVRYFRGGFYGRSNPFSQYSHIADPILAPDFKGIFLTYDEVLFYRAEAAARGYIAGATVEALYNAAITASILSWGGTTAEATAYLAKPDVAYASATGTWQQKIGTQAYLAFYTRGLESYTEWRRLDFPILNMPPTIDAYSEIPKRFTYPVNEQTLNASNYAAAASATVGGDELTSKLFWDKF